MTNSDKNKFSQQRVRDPVHDLIVFDGDEFGDGLWKIVQSEPFQRLRRIKQLGFSDFVFPGATHSRFAHSLGVFHIAKQLMKVIRRQQGRKDYLETKANSAIAASLMHDLGHGPFSHAFEETCSELEGAPKSHEEMTKRLITESDVCSFGGLGCKTDDIIEHIESPQTIYGAVVSSQLDADRLDYMQRDCLMTGSKHPSIDFNWLVDNMRIGKYPSRSDKQSSGEEIETLVIGPKAHYAAETYILSLFHLYPTIYFHKTTRGIETLFRAMLKEVFHIAKGDYNQKDLGLYSTHPLIKFIKSPDKLENYLALDDTIIWSSLPFLKNAKNEFIKNTAERLLSRKLYKAHDMISKFMDKAIQEWPRKSSRSDELKSEKQRLAFVTKAQAILDQKIEEETNTKPKFKETILLDQGHRDLYKKDSNEPICIRSDASTQSVEDIGNFSSIINASCRYEFFRVYTPEKSCDSAELLGKLAKESIRESLKGSKNL